MDKIDFKKCSKSTLQKLLFGYKLKSHVTNFLIKTGIAIDYALPFIFSCIIALNISEKTDVPYVIEDDNFTQEFTFDREELDENCFIYSTGWTFNGSTNGLERTEITYRLNEEVDLSDIETIMSMSDEELKKTFTIDKIRKIDTVENQNDNYFYREDMIIVPSVQIDGSEKLVRSTMRKEDVDRTLMFLVIAFASAITCRNFENVVTHSYIKSRLTDKLIYCQDIDEEIIRDLNNLYNTRPEQKPKKPQLKNNDKKLNFKKMGYCYKKCK